MNLQLALIPALILIIFPTVYSETVPDWVKNTAGWWATDAISETEFVNAIGYLVNIGIIDITSNNCIDNFLKYFSDKEKIIDVCNDNISNLLVELTPYENNIIFNSHGFRGQELSIEKPANTFRIFMVGGSTMVSTATTNDSTIPSLVQKMFDLQTLDHKVEVINAGISGGNSSTELQLIKSKIVDYNPDLLIMYDGWNDLSADYPAEYIVKNWEQVCSIGNQENFDVIIALQPIAGFSEKSLTTQEKINSLTGQDHNGYQIIQAKSTYESIARQLDLLGNDAKLQLGDEVCQTHDLRPIFDSVNGSIYWDQGHVLHAGNLILAEKFFELSMKKINPLHIPEEKFLKIISNHNNHSSIKFLFNELDVNEISFHDDFLPSSKIPSEKGRYFQLKDEIGLEKILVGKDLRDVDLTKLDIMGQDLTGADLSGHDLRNIDFTNTIIRGSNLSNTNLQGVDMSEMDLRGINFSNANLKDVDFTDAIFSKTIQIIGNCTDENPIVNVIKNFKCISIVIENEEIRTNFKNADLTNVKFGSDKNEKNQMVYFVDFTNANLTNVDLYSVHFFGNNFTDAKLNGISGKQVFILESDFTNSEMKNFKISESWFQSSSFYNADMRNGNFESITFIDLDFSDTDLQGTEFTSLNEIGDNDYSCKNNGICTT